MASETRKILLLVAWTDAHGGIRAYASGPPKQQDEIARYAYKQLQEYFAGKKQKGILPPSGPYTESFLVHYQEEKEGIEHE
jgi:hypothetical protein